MPVWYDDTENTYVISPDHCENCKDDLYDTGCDAPGCSARCCMSCGTGCDIELDPEEGQCATALAMETDSQYYARVDRERAAFGLAPLTMTEGAS